MKAETAEASEATETTASSKPLARSRTRIRPARFDDYEQIVRLEAVLKSEPPSAGEWRMFWQGSPLWPKLGKSWPIGWVVETAAAEIIGCIGNIPLMYRFRGESLIAASARGWVVEPNHRGTFAVRLLVEHLDQAGVDLSINTTVGPMALACGDRFTNRIPAGDWETIAYYITGYRAFATRALQKLNVPLAPALGPLAGAVLWLKDVPLNKKFSKACSSFVIEATDRFDSRFDAFWDELLRQKADTLLAARDSATLSWHFALPMSLGRIWILTASRNSHLRAYCIFIRHDHGDELRRVRLVDYQTIDPDVDLLPDFLRTALQRCVAESVCVLDKAGVGMAKTCVFDEFAPYRRKQSWPFFYRASDSALADELRQPEVWDPSEYDGDATLG